MTTPETALDTAALAVDAALSAAIWHTDTARTLTSTLHPDAVRTGPQATVLAALAGLLQDGHDIDPASVAGRVCADQRPHWPDVASRYLPDLVSGLGTAASVTYHVQIAHDALSRQRMHTLGERLQQRSGSADLAWHVDAARAELDAVLTAPPVEVPTVADSIDALLTDLEQHVPARAWPTGLTDLDSILGAGFQAGQLVIVGARPGAGKSVLLTDIGRHVAIVNGGRVLLRSLEMSRDEVLSRCLAAEARIDLSRITGRAITDTDWSRIGGPALGRLSSGAMHVDDTPRCTLADLDAQLRTLQPDVLMVDYLQLMQPVKSSGSREQDVAAMSRGLKLLAKTHRCVVIVAAQLNRQSTSRSDPKPRLTDLRESGSIEQDADVVILIHRDPDDDLHGTVAELIVAKHRNGPTGTVEVAFSGHYSHFEGMSA